MVSCAPRTTELSLPFDAPQAFSTTGEAAAPEHWWRAFEDPELNHLVDRALASNFDLQSAWQRLREAQAIVDRESSNLFPTLDGFADASVNRPEEEENESLRLGLTAEYEVDLWGRIRAGVEAERFRAEATRADIQAAALSLAAEVARTWYQLVEARHQVRLLAEQIEANQKVLSLLESRFDTGQVRGVDILRQRQLVEATREQQIAAESRLGVLEHLLAVLLGQPPQEDMAITPGALPELPPLPGTGLPLDLVRRRPDIERSYKLLYAADRELAAAVANQYPRLSLSGSLATVETDTGALFEDWTRSLTASLTGPIFDAGERDAEVDRNEALRRQRLYDYGQATLTAFQEVEDALVREQKQEARIDSLREQLALAEQASAQLRIEYFNGLGDYIDVLSALTEEQQIRRELLEARRVLLEYRIALYRALAGGFEVEEGMETPR